MAPQRDRKRKESVAQSNKEVADEIVKNKERTRQNSEEALAKTQEALRGAQAKVRQERQARAKAEKALAKAQQALAAAGQERQAQTRRVSFVVRLILDEHGQPRRTEIEQVESSRKQNFLGLDGERLVAFMKAHINSIIVPEDVIPTRPSPQKVTTPMPWPLRPKSQLIVSDVQAFHTKTPGFMTLILTSGEPFVVQARFQLQGPDSDSVTIQEPSYEMNVYANEVTSGQSKLLTTYSARLIPNVLEYTAPAEIPRLSSGLYRLFTVVVLGVPIEMAGFYGKTIIQVI